MRKFIENRTIKRLRKKLLKIAKDYVTGLDTILDIGCGKKGSLDYSKIMDEFKYVVGLDKSRKNIEEFNKIFSLNINGKSLDIEKDELEGEYDVIISAGVIQYLDNPKTLLKKTNKHLKRFGIFIIATINKDALIRKLGFIKKELKGGEKQIYNLEGLREELKNNNFLILEEKGVDFIWLPKKFCSNIIITGRKNA